jgi:hypothetical protein
MPGVFARGSPSSGRKPQLGIGWGVTTKLGHEEDPARTQGDTPLKAGTQRGSLSADEGGIYKRVLTFWKDRFCFFAVLI